MTINLDHLILRVTNVDESVNFYRQTLRLNYEADALLRVSPTLVLQLIEEPPSASTHLAFSMSRAEQEEIVERLRAAQIPFGGGFSTVGTMTGPGRAHGSQKNGASIYFRDPDKHMLEIIHYEPMP